ncbi:MAG: RNA-binding protein [Flavobacteriales bacterium]|nr:RNA-binding protein [Flavobacteriales bacterium]|tara:strand:- start:1175 stop:1465 length:291 start_codon:yes stop_codon:yes gene_type:complete
MRRAQGQTIAEVIKELLKNYNITSKFNEAYVVTSWDKLMGPSVTKYTVSIEVEKRILFVRLSNAALKQELSYSKERIREMLNQEVGEEVITEVRIY